MVDLTHDSNVDLQLLDLDSDNRIDRAEWSTTDEITEYYLVAKIILATDGLHLDSNRDYVDDVFYEIKTKDNIWTHEIPAGDFVRVTFERVLDSTNDISIFAKSGGSASINIYEKDGTEVIATIDGISAESFKTALLSNLISTQDVFDLEIVGDAVAFDLIIDPPTKINLEQCHNWDSGAEVVLDCDDPAGPDNAWGSGNANSANARVAEGDSQNYRVIITDLAAGNWTMVFEQDLTKGGAMAQDFWTGPGNLPTETFPGLNNTGVHPCVDTKGDQSGYCNPSLNGTNASGWVEVDIPDMGVTPDSDLNDAIDAAQDTHHQGGHPANQITEGMILIGNISDATLTVPTSGFSGSVESDSSIQGILEFELLSEGNVVLYYGGHISETEDYDEEPGPLSKPTATTIPGSPYHNRLISFDGINGDTGNQDMQLASAALVDPPSLILNKIIINDDGGSASESDFTLTASGQDVNTNLIGQGDTGDEDVISDENFEAGTYLLFESAVSGYTNDGYDCVGEGTFNAGAQTITLGNGESAVCTIINRSK
jgi:hypothetical protein